MSANFEGHTPGPWHVGTMNDAIFVINEPPRPGPVDCHNHTLSTKVIAKPGEPYSEGFTFEEYQANARLIAAAPDLLKQRDQLLAACKELVRVLDACVMLGVGDEGSSDGPRAKALAAIAAVEKEEA